MARTTWHRTIPKQWNDTLFSRGGHFLQSSHWAHFQQSLDKEVFMAKGAGWQCLALLEDSPFGRRIYCPYGPFAESRTELSQAFNALKDLADTSHAAYIRVEPIGSITTKDIIDFKAKRAPKNVQPQHTWVKGLERPSEELLTEMSATNRNLYRNSSKKGLTVRQSREPADIDILIDMIRNVAEHTGITPHHDTYYRKMAQALLPDAGLLYIVEHHGQPVAAAFIFDCPAARYYAHAGSIHAFRKLHAGSPLLTQAILDANSDGRKQFDFVGVAPPDESDHRWNGFTQFKKSFGGKTISYPGTWEIPTNSIRYGAYRLYHLVSRLRKL